MWPSDFDKTTPESGTDVIARKLNTYMFGNLTFGLSRNLRGNTGPYVGFLGKRVNSCFSCFRTHHLHQHPTQSVIIDGVIYDVVMERKGSTSIIRHIETVLYNLLL
jgi:hypothetical protein